MTETQRIPKWLMDERFALFHEHDKGKMIFRIQIFDSKNDPFDGYGESIGAAAKHARKNRETCK